MPIAVLRRYTPPTCTLEIAATQSALSYWADRTVIKDIQFQLSFDDPKLPPEQQITVSGERTQLEALCEVVQHYTQQFLSADPAALPWESSLQSSLPFSAAAALPTPSDPAAALPHPPTVALLNPPEVMGMQLQPQGLLSHRLQLGSLATAESGESVRLTALQLFDLANALEAYQTDTLSLPASSRPAWIPKLPRPWAIAAVSILALGATGTIAKFILDIANPTMQTASAPQEREVNSELGSELFPALSPPPLEASPSITLQPLPPPAPAGANSATSPGLPPVGVTQAPPAAQSGAPTAAQPVPPATVPTAPAGNPSQVTIIPDPTIASAPAQSLAESSRSAEPPRLAETSGDALDSPIAAAPNSSSSTAFDAIPQVAEVRSYFQQTWQPSDLSQILEYRLLLSADGSLQRIVPLGQASEQYIDRTNMPLMGEPFVSPTQDGSTPQIRLVLKPDGKVQTFLEYAD